MRWDNDNQYFKNKIILPLYPHTSFHTSKVRVNTHQQKAKNTKQNKFEKMPLNSEYELWEKIPIKMFTYISLLIASVFMIKLPISFSFSRLTTIEIRWESTFLSSKSFIHSFLRPTFIIEPLIFAFDVERTDVELVTLKWQFSYAVAKLGTTSFGGVLLLNKCLASLFKSHASKGTLSLRTW